MTSPVIQFKRGNLVNLPPLEAGEPALTLDTFEFYIGINSTSEGNKFFGSHRYWTKESSSTGSGVNLVEGTANGSNYITLKSPDSLAGVTTYTFPATPQDGYFLKTNANGTLEWNSLSIGAAFSNARLEDTTLTGVSTFTGQIQITNDTQSTDKDTGSLIVEGGVGIEKNLNVGGDLKVIGVSTFVGAVTFEGGTITLGDEATDSVVFAADVNSNIIPNIDATYDFGVSSQRWRNGIFSGIITATTFVGALTGTATSTTNIPNLTGAITSNNTITSLGSFSSSNLATALTDETGSGAAVFATSPTLVTPTLGDASAISIEVSNVVNVGTALSVPTIKTATIQHSNGTGAATIDSSGNIIASQNLTVGGNLFVNGNTTQVNTTTLTIEDVLIEIGLVNGNAPNSDVNIDLGILFNYYKSSAKKAAVYWDDSVERIAIASEVAEANNVLAANAYAALEIGELWVNDCAGQSQVISCAAGVRTLQNITIDAGTF